MEVIEKSDASTLLIDILNGLLSANIRVVVLRDYLNLPYDWRNDIDILIREGEFIRVQRIIREIVRDSPATRGASELLRLNFWSISVSCDDRPLVLDITTAFTRQWSCYADPRQVFKRSREYGDLFRVPHPIDQRLLLAAKELLAYGHIRSRYHEWLSEAIRHSNTVSLEKAAFSLMGGFLTKNGCLHVARAVIEPTLTGRPARRISVLLTPLNFIKWIFLRCIHSSRRRSL